jgi:hypothetical protein
MSVVIATPSRLHREEGGQLGADLPGGLCNPPFLSANQLMARDPLPFDFSYGLWRAEFALFEAECLGIVSEFVRVNFDTLMDRYYCEGHESLNNFPAWAFERYLRKLA